MASNEPEPPHYEYYEPGLPPYSYGALPHPCCFRIVRLLLSSCIDDDVKCELVTACLSDAYLPSYTTLSYAWGPTFSDGSHLSKTITCDGGRLQVTESLHQALKRIRQVTYRARPDQYCLPLWIDGICINQADITERNVQVGLMTQIYARCQNMFIWLGENSDNVGEWLEKFTPAVHPGATHESESLPDRSLSDATFSLLSKYLKGGDVPSSTDFLRVREESGSASQGEAALGQIVLADVIRVGDLWQVDEQIKLDISRLYLGKNADCAVCKRKSDEESPGKSVRLLLQAIRACWSSGSEHVAYLERPHNKWRQELLVEMLHIPCIEAELCDLMPQIRAVLLKCGRVADLKAAEHAKRHELQRLLQRPWFRRKWVIQEVALTARKSRVILLGDLFIGFDSLTRQLEESGLLDQAPPLGPDLTRNLLQNMMVYLNTECSDPHDHIFSLFGLEGDRPKLAIDYSQPVHSLYTEVAEYYIRQGNGLAILALATAKQPGLDLPSWVPDWRVPWSCHRSPSHADAMSTLGLGARSLTETVIGVKANEDSKLTVLDRRLLMNCWIVPSLCCCSGEVFCKHCLLLHGCTPESGSDPTTQPEQPEVRRRGRNWQGKQPSRVPNLDEDLVGKRRTYTRNKWLPAIIEQLKLNLDPNEVLCFVFGSPFGFVLRSVNGSINAETLSTYRLEFCVQVDEAGWVSNWFAFGLGFDSQEVICIV